MKKFFLKLVNTFSTQEANGAFEEFKSYLNQYSKLVYSSNFNYADQMVIE